MCFVHLSGSPQPDKQTPLLTDKIIQIQHRKSLNTESSLSVCNRACELSPVIEVTNCFRAGIKCDLETAYFDKLSNTLCERDFTDSGLCLRVIFTE